MANDQVTLRFTEVSPPYRKGEVATFTQVEADKLRALGVVEDAGKNADNPEGESAPLRGGESPAPAVGGLDGDAADKAAAMLPNRTIVTAQGEAKPQPELVQVQGDTAEGDKGTPLRTALDDLQRVENDNRDESDQVPVAADVEPISADNASEAVEAQKGDDKKKS